VFHERASAEVLDSLARKITVESAALQIPVLEISEGGYLPLLEHKNKYGKDYPPVIDEQPAYPGAKK
jgi:hypothetical protein